MTFRSWSSEALRIKHLALITKNAGTHSPGMDAKPYALRPTLFGLIFCGASSDSPVEVIRAIGLRGCSDRAEGSLFFLRLLADCGGMLLDFCRLLAISVFHLQLRSCYVMLGILSSFEKKSTSLPMRVLLAVCNSSILRDLTSL